MIFTNFNESFHQSNYFDKKHTTNFDFDFFFKFTSPLVFWIFFQNDKSETKKKIINVPQSVGFLDIQLDVHRSYRRNLDGCHSSIEKLSFDHWCIEILSNSVRPPHLGNQANGCIPNFYRSMYRPRCNGIDLDLSTQVFLMLLTFFSVTLVVEF